VLEGWVLQLSRIDRRLEGLDERSERRGGTRPCGSTLQHPDAFSTSERRELGY
jgi:hypothetical protein